MPAQEFGKLDLEQERRNRELQQQLPTETKNLPLEKAIDPAEYILGPGDKIGLNIITSKSMIYLLTVTPTGDLMIPSVGIIPVTGQTVERAAIDVRDFVNKYSFPNAKVNVALVELRTFLIQITGAVNKPGFHTVNPTERLSDIILRSGGFHQFAREFSIDVIRNNKDNFTINYLDYLREGDLESNPTFLEGDKIIVSFGNVENEGIVLRGAVTGSGYDIIEPNETLGAFLQRRVKFNMNADLERVIIIRKVEGKKIFINVEPRNFLSTKLHARDIVEILWEKRVMVNGFVYTPGGYGYFPGYISADYISLAGGNTINGDPNRCIIIHRDGTKEKGLMIVIRRGDVIVVPRTLKDALIGDVSFMQIIVSLVTILLTYLAIGG
jgi:protein involved in polysaccharide export with SLBB domain